MQTEQMLRLSAMFSDSVVGHAFLKYLAEHSLTVRAPRLELPNSPASRVMALDV
jgi:hypothetical protein